MLPFFLRGLLQKESFWCCFPSPSLLYMRALSCRRLEQKHRSLWSSVCALGSKLLPLLTGSVAGVKCTAGAAREMLCAVLCCAMQEV